MPPDFRSRRPKLMASDSNCCARLSPASADWRSWPMSAVPLSCWICAGFRQRLRMYGLEVTTLEIRRGEDIASAVEALKGRAEALYVVLDPLVNTHRIRINTLVLAARLPTMHALREQVEAGGLMSYGANFP